MPTELNLIARGPYGPVLIKNRPPTLPFNRAFVKETPQEVLNYLKNYPLVSYQGIEDFHFDDVLQEVPTPTANAFFLVRGFSISSYQGDSTHRSITSLSFSWLQEQSYTPKQHEQNIAYIARKHFLLTSSENIMGTAYLDDKIENYFHLRKQGDTDLEKEQFLTHTLEYGQIMINPTFSLNDIEEITEREYNKET